MRHTQSDYNKTFYAKHKDEILKKYKCDLCGGSFSLKTKHNHQKTVKHQYQLLKLQLEKNKKTEDPIKIN